MAKMLFLHLFIALFTSFAAFGQLTIFAGPQITSAKYTIRGTNQPTDYKTGYTVGVGLQGLIEGPLYFAPFIYYSKKGYKVTLNRPSFPPDSGALNNNTTLHTVEFAPLFQINLSKKPAHFFVRFGPTLDINISGRETFDSLGGKKIEQAMPFGYAEYGYATAAGCIQFGYQTKKGLTVFAHYSYGVGSLNNADEGPKILHRIAGICLGWQFRKKSKL